MKKIISLFLAMIICAVLASCGESATESDVPEGMKLVECDDEKSYSLYVPDEWTIDMSTGTVSAYVSSSDSSNITFTGFSPDSVTDLDIPTFWADYEEDFASTFGDTMHYVSGGEELESNEDYEPSIIENFGGSGSNAYRYVYTALVSGDTYKFMQVVCATGGYIYILTYTSTLDNYDTNIEDVQSIIDNFKFN